MKNRFTITILYFFILLSQLPAAAQNKSGSYRITVEQAIAATLENNFDIQLLRNDSISYTLDKSYARAAFLPRVNATTGLVYNNNNQKQRLADGTKRESNGVRSSNLTGSVQLNWTLFDGLKMFATKDKLAEFVKLGELNIKNQMVNSVAAVINNYYNIVRQKQQLKAIEEQMGINEERVKVAEKKLSVGLGAKPELLQGKVDLNAQKAAKLLQQTLIIKLKEQLNQLMSVEQSAMYDVVDSIPINTSLTLSDIQSGIEKNNASLLIAKKNIDIAGLSLKEIKAERFPTVSFNSAYNFSRTNNKAVINSFSTLFNRTKGFNYGLTATIPILNNFTIKRQIRQAQLSIQYQQLVYDNQKSLINLSIISAYNDYLQQKEALALEEESIVLAKENVNILFQVYKLNSTTLIQLKEAEKSLGDAYNRLIAARYSTKVAETELLRLKGELVR